MAWRHMHGMLPGSTRACMEACRCTAVHACTQVYRQEEEYFRSLLAAIRDPQTARQALDDLQEICSRCAGTCQVC